MNCSINVTALVGLATLMALLIAPMSAEQELKVFKLNRGLVSVSDDSKVFSHAGRLRRKKDNSGMASKLTVWTSEELKALVPMDLYASNNTSLLWSAMIQAALVVATVTDNNGQISYYTSPMPSGVQPNLDLMLEIGEKYNDC